MSDLNHHDEEEYHFDDSENFDFGEHAAEEEFIGDEEVVEDTNTKDWNNARSTNAVSAKKPLMNKKIFAGVGIVILLIVGYYLMMPHGKAPATTSIPAVTTPKTPVKAKPTAPPQTTAPASNNPVSNNDVTATQQQNTQNAVTASSANTTPDNASNGDWLNTGDDTQASTPATTSPAAASTAMPNDNGLSLQVQTLNQENQALTLKLQALTAQSEATAARANSLEKMVAQLQAQMKQMAQATPAPLQRPKAMAAEPVTTKAQTSIATSASKTALVYYVQAIIPGRAWIGDSNGRIITVTQGDRVEALGSTVTNIDPINGIVTLSNGMQIEYGMVAQ